MNVSDEQLMAYVDGELDDATRADVERAIAADPGLAKRVAEQRALAAQLRGAFDHVLEERVPERLRALVETAVGSPTAVERSTPAPAAGPPVADLATARERRASRRWAWPEWSAIAASLVIGVLVAQVFRGTPDSPGRVTTWTADAALDRALSSQPSGVAGAVRVAFTFRDDAGALCRTFATDASAGYACRRDGRWRVEMLAPAEPAPAGGSATYRQAASTLPSAVLAAIDARISGEPLDATAEAAALATK